MRYVYVHNSLIQTNICTFNILYNNIVKNIKIYGRGIQIVILWELKEK